MMSMKRLHSRPSRQTSRQRAGYAYIGVLVISTIIVMLGSASLMVVRLERKATEARYEAQEARLLALSAIEHAITRIRQTGTGWRTTFPHNTEYPVAPVTLGNGSFTWLLHDPDGLLNDDPTDSVELLGIGRVGDATYVHQVLLTPQGDGLDCLEVALYTTKKHTLAGGTLTCNQIIGTEKTCDLSGGMIVDSDVEANAGTTGATFLGSVDNAGPVRTMPNAVTVLDYYLANGTTIDFTDLPLIGGVRTIDRTYLGPDSNPYGLGTTNSEGIYVVNCLQAELPQVIRIQDSRIVGTLVILDSASTSKTTGALNWSPAIANFPAVLCTGQLAFDHNRNTLLNETTLSTNFNPTEDVDTLDVYPTVIKGIVYTEGNVDFSSNPAFNGAIVAGGALNMTSGNPDLIYDSQFAANPPPGFESGTGSGDMKIVKGTWFHATSP